MNDIDEILEAYDYARRHPDFDDFPFFEDVIYGFERIRGAISKMTSEVSGNDTRH